MLIFLLHFAADTLVWTEVKDSGLDGTGQVALRPLLAHTTTTVGSYLFVLAGHNGADFTNDLLAFNLGQPAPPPPSLAPRLLPAHVPSSPSLSRSDPLVGTPPDLRPAPVGAGLPLGRPGRLAAGRVRGF